MCNPLAFMAVSTGISLLAGGVQYKASKDAQAYNSAMAKTNAKVAEDNAIDAERLGQIEATERRMKTRQELATQQVGFAAQNVELSGTALDILGDTAMFGEADERRIRADAARRAYGYRMEGFNIKAQDKLDRYKGRMDRVGTVLTTASSVAGSYGSYKGWT